MSLITFVVMVCMPTGSMPQACLAPQYQPSQLSGWRACLRKPPVRFSKFVWQPWAAWTFFVSPWPSDCARMENGPASSWMRLISVAMRSHASSHEMRTYFDVPRFWVLRSPFGSQSTRLSGYGMRFGE